MDRAKSVFIETFGCQMNEHDSQHIEQILTSNGFKIVPAAIDAGVIIVNTCSVRYGPENKMNSYLGRARPIKEKYPELIIAVGGCVAQQEKENIIKRDKIVDIVFGPDNISAIAELIENAQATSAQLRPKQVRTDWNKAALETLNKQRFGSLPQAGRAYISITKGCDNFCSFCIVPYTRGREISRSAQSIVAEAAHLVSLGALEITLVGQNVNSYQCEGTSFLDLLALVAAVPGLMRLRFISPHPKDWQNEHTDLMAKNAVICKQLHLPFQSGSSRILKLMRRDHDIDSYLAKIDYVKKTIPDICLSTDIIVGFPGETEADFQATLEALNYVKFAQVYAFKYSPRPGTRAARLEDDVSFDLKNERLQRLIAQQHQTSRELLQGYLGQELEILVTNYNEKTGQSLGKSSGNVTINVNGKLNIGESYRVQVNGALTNSLVAAEISTIAEV